MSIKEFINDHLLSGQESDWLEFITLTLVSGELAIADPTLYPDGAIAYLHPGRYCVQVKLLLDDGYPIVTMLRVFARDNLEEGNHITIGGTVGEVSVDFGRIGVADNKIVKPYTTNIDLELAESIWASLETSEIFGVLTYDADHIAIMPFVTPGYGDGRYSVFYLERDSHNIGIEISFIA
ncbi:MAG TPA: hypothetical protein PKA06_01680 [Gemmatales bacterium]|nr:hypothetical protein [Gemmatales bacterium]